MKRTAWSAVVACLAASPCGGAGAIPFRAGVQVFDANQRALIAFNGREELLIVSSDLRASEPTKVLEVLPLPGRPVVSRADLRLFRRSVRLLDRKRFFYWGEPADEPGPPDGASGEKKKDKEIRPPEFPAAMVTFQRTIGATNVSVVHVLDEKRFAWWARRFLRSRGVEKPQIPAELEQAVRSYIHDGFRWFAFHVVSLGPKMRTRGAIHYVFRSKYAYYPLRIGGAGPGETRIQLLLLTPGDHHARRFRGLSGESVRRGAGPVDLRWDELTALHKPLFTFLGNPPKSQLRLWEIRGKPDSFSRDLRPCSSLRRQHRCTATVSFPVFPISSSVPWQGASLGWCAGKRGQAPALRFGGRVCSSAAHASACGPENGDRHLRCASEPVPVFLDCPCRRAKTSDGERAG